ncbi:MAG TPA: heme-binding protein [Clostridiaceae bacterium]
MNELLTELLAQEEALQFTTFTNEDALSLGLIIINIAKEKIGKGIAVCIVKDSTPLFTHLMEGTTKENIYWLNTKSNVTIKFAHSSLYMGEKYKAEGTTFKEATGLNTDEYQGEGGSFPLIIMGKGAVGSVTVSGLTGEDDHSTAAEGIRNFLSLKK